MGMEEAPAVAGRKYRQPCRGAPQRYSHHRVVTSCFDTPLPRPPLFFRAMVLNCHRTVASAGFILWIPRSGREDGLSWRIALCSTLMPSSARPGMTLPSSYPGGRTTSAQNGIPTYWTRPRAIASAPGLGVKMSFYENASKGWGTAGPPYRAISRVARP